MRKSFIKVMFFGALALSTVTYVGCKDYDDDISNLQEQIDANKAGIAELKQKVDNGNWVKSVTEITNGFKITFNDGKSYDIVSGKDGAAGKSTLVEIKDGYWYIDGVNQKIQAAGTPGDKGDKGEAGAQGPQGEHGLSPYIGADGYWYFYSPENEGANADGWVKGKDLANQASTIYVVQEANKPCFTLHAMDKETNQWISTPLPNAMKISSMAAISIDNAGTIGAPSDVNLYYGKLATKVEFGPEGMKKTYEANSFVTSNSGTIHALINPINVDFSSASNYTIGLTNSKGVTAFVVNSIKQNMSENALTRSAEVTANKGVFDLTVALNPTFDKTKLAAMSSDALALTTLDAWGQEIISSYDVKVKALTTTAPAPVAATGLKAPYDENVSLDDLYFSAANTGIINLSYTVDHYYTLVTPSDDIKIDNQTKSIKAAKPQAGVEVYVNYLTTAGTVDKVKMTVDFEKSGEQIVVSNIDWAIPTDDVNAVDYSKKLTTKVYVGDVLNNFFKAHAVKFDAAGYAIAATETKLEGATDTDGQKITINEGEEATFAPASITYALEKGVDAEAGKYFIKATFAPSTIIAVNHHVKLKLTDTALSSGAAVGGDIINTIKLDVNIKQVDGNLFNLPSKRLSNHFTGTAAFVYGDTPASLTATTAYNLFNLYAAPTAAIKANITFDEVVPAKDADGNVAAEWFASSTEKASGAIVVSTVEKANGGIYAPREISVLYKPYNNPGLKYITDNITVEVGSSIYGKSGKLITTTKTLTVKKDAPATLTVKDFKWMDAILGEYKTLSDGTTYNAKLSTVTFEGDDNAKQYLTFGTEFSQKGKTDADKIDIAKKASPNEITEDVTCVLTLTVKDMWGKVTKVPVTVTLKADAEKKN